MLAYCRRSSKSRHAIHVHRARLKLLRVGFASWASCRAVRAHCTYSALTALYTAASCWAWPVAVSCFFVLFVVHCYRRQCQPHIGARGRIAKVSERWIYVRARGHDALYSVPLLDDISIDMLRFRNRRSWSRRSDRRDPSQASNPSVQRLASLLADSSHARFRRCHRPRKSPWCGSGAVAVLVLALVAVGATGYALMRPPGALSPDGVVSQADQPDAAPCSHRPLPADRPT